MVRTLADAGLEPPPVPEPMKNLLHAFGPWHWATREIEPMDMYVLLPLAEEVLEGRASDYVAVTHAGHGVNSYSLNLGILFGPIALLVQTGWGGAYMDAHETAQRWGVLTDRSRSVIEMLEDRVLTDDLGPGRLLIVDSDFTSISACGWVDESTPTSVREWVAADSSANAFDAAHAWLKARTEGRL